MSTGPVSLPSRVQRQQAALLAIAASWRHHEADLDGALRAITETAVSAMDVERASVWLFDEARAKIVCEDLFERTPGRHSRGVELAARDFPRYFAALGTEEVIAASDAEGTTAKRPVRLVVIASRTVVHEGAAGDTVAP